MSASGRCHYLDNLRALAMLTGVLFHAALAYSPLAHPFMPTADHVQSVAVDASIWFVHLFRMPLFFVVAGYFAALLVAKRGLGGLFRNRLRRVALPFVVFLPLALLALDLSTRQAALSVANPSPMLLVIRKYLQAGTMPEALPGTTYLWFLYYLMLFYVLVWAAKSYELGRVGRHLRAVGFAWLALLPVLLALAFMQVSAPHPAPESLFPQFWAFGLFGPFFLGGYLLHGREAVVDRLRPFAPWLFGASLLLYIVFWKLVRAQVVTAQDYSAAPPIALVEGCIAVWMTVVCLVAGKAWLDHGNALLRYLSDASYWVYLVHLPILFAIQYRLLDVELPWPAKISIAVAATFALCLASYHMLVRATRIGGLLGVRAASPARI